MANPRLILVALAVAGSLALCYAGLAVGDAAPPAKLAGLVEYGRSNRPANLGPGGLLPFRFVEARCAADGRSALLFANALGVKYYAVVSAIPPVDAPDRVFVIGAQTVAEFDQSSFGQHPVSCGSVVRPRAAGEYWLPMWERRGLLCPASALTGATLRGSPDDLRISWVGRLDGRRMDIGWPPGFRARFTPNLEVLDTDDHVVAREGAMPTGYCGGPDGSLLTDFLPTDWYERWYGPTSYTRSLEQGEYWLPVAWSLFNGTHLCGGGGYSPEPRLHGSPDDPRLVWMVDPAGKRLELAWPPGFSVRFTPRLVVLNARGDAVAFDGSRAASGCGTGEGAIYVDFWR